MKCKYCGKEMDLTEWEVESENITMCIYTCPHCRAILEQYSDFDGVFRELWITYVDGHKQVRVIYHDINGDEQDFYI